MKNTPLVSAIIIFLNTEKYLAEAIESVFAQTYQNWELLLVDDGSTDGSTEIARRYAERFPDKVSYLEHEGHVNRGMSATRNLGFKHAKGEFISWLDSDDVWLPNKLEEQTRILTEYPEVAMVYGPLHIWFSWTGLPEDINRDIIQDIGLSAGRVVPPPKLLTHFLQNDNYIPGGGMIRRTVLDAVGGYEEWIEDDFEDEIVHFKVCLKWPVYASSQSWYKYRQHDDSFCAQVEQTGGDQARRYEYYMTLAKRLRAEGIDDKDLWQVVEKQLEIYRPSLRKRVRKFVSHVKRGGVRRIKSLVQ